MPTCPRIMRIRRKEISGLVSLTRYVQGSNLTMVEIGSYAGESTEIFAFNKKFERVYAVDPWENGYDDEDGADQHDGEIIADFSQKGS